MSRDSLQWIFMAEYASYALAANRYRQTWMWGYMRLRAMILDTFAYKKSVKMHSKSTLREALEPTWTALGQNIKNTSKKTIFRGSLLESILSPFWVLESIQGSPDLIFFLLGYSFLDHFCASTRAPQNVLGSVLATVSARFSQVQWLSKRWKHGA